MRSVKNSRVSQILLGVGSIPPFFSMRAAHLHRGSNRKHPPHPTNQNRAPSVPSPRLSLFLIRRSMPPGCVLHGCLTPKAPARADDSSRFALRGSAAPALRCHAPSTHQRQSRPSSRALAHSPAPLIPATPLPP